MSRASTGTTVLVKGNRPLWRSVVKLACRLLGHERAHYHSWLPWLKISGRTPQQAGAVHFHGRRIVDLCSLGELKARAGERIVIVGSGPSIKDADLSGLPPRTAILLNGAISLIGEGIAMPLAVAIEDERFVWRHFDMIRNTIGKDTLCLLAPGVIRALCEIDPAWIVGCSVILIDDVRKPYGLPRRSFDDLLDLEFAVLSLDETTGFSIDPDKGVFQGGSVAISALQFAIATGAREIGFIGVDISNADGPRFYEQADNIAFSGIAGAEARILAHIALANAYGEQHGVRLVNHSEVSALALIGLENQPLDQTRS